MNQKMKQKSIAILAIVFLIAMPALLSINLVHAQTGTATGTISAVFIDNTGALLTSLPDNTETLSSTAVGQQVIVLLQVSGATNLWSLKTDLTWNNAVLQLTGVAQGNDPAGTADFLGRTPTSATLFIGGDSSTWKVDGSGNGYISGGISETRTTATATTLSSGNWCTLYFTIVGTGHSDISLANGLVTDVNGAYNNAGLSSASVQVGSVMQAPEYAFGAIIAMSAAFVAFIAFAAYKKGISFPTLSKHIA